MSEATQEKLIEEIESINQKLAKIAEKVKENPNYDAESIERTKLKIHKYNLQQELRSLLQQENGSKVITLNGPTSAPKKNTPKQRDKSKVKPSNLKGDTPPKTTTPPKVSDGDLGAKSQNSTGEIARLERAIKMLNQQIANANEALKDPKKTSEELAKIEEMIKGYEKDKERYEKQIEELKAKAKNEKPSEGKSTGEDTVREGWLLRLVRWFRARAKDGGRWASFLDWCETKLISSKKALPDASKKKTKKKKEITKKKTKTAEKSEPTAENGQRKKDILWIKEKCETTHAGATILDTMVAAAYQKATSGNNSGKSLTEEYFKVILEKEGRPKVLNSSKENLYYEYTRDKILEKAKKEGIQTEGKDGKARPIENVYNELEEKRKLREKTDGVSAKAAQIANGNPRQSQRTKRFELL